MKGFFGLLDSLPQTGQLDPDLVNYCERFLELMTDLEVSTVAAVVSSTYPSDTSPTGAAANKEVLQYSNG